jgi:hypothetical protein
MDNKDPTIENKLEIENKNTNNDIEDEPSNDELPEYEDDEDFKRQMNEAIMRNMSKLEEESNSVIKTLKKKKIKNKKISNNISLGSFMKVVDDDKPKVFISKRKQDKIGIQYKRIFNPRKPPYLLVNIKKNISILDENNFPSL